MLTLIFRDLGGKKRFTLPAGDSVVGRAPNCDLVLNDPSVSRWHARFSLIDSQCVVTDIGSRYGTFKDGEQITSASLSDGDVVVLGSVPVRVEHSAADRVLLSDEATRLDLPGAIARPAARLEAERKNSTIADSRRLLDLMTEIARTLVRPQNVADVLEKVVDLAFETVAAERAVLILAGPGGSFVPRVVRRRDGRADPEAATISRTVLNRVFAERVALLASDVRVDTTFRSVDSILAQHVGCFMCTPLWQQEQVIGVMYVDTPRLHGFSAADLDLFTAFSDYAAIAIEQARLNVQLLQETRRRERLQRYHSPAVVERILQSGDEAEAPFIAQERDLTVLFADIVGFTALAEQLPPAGVAQVLNKYLGCMTNVIFDLEGTLDKFIGDAVMGVFGAPIDQPDHAVRAVRAAQQMRAAVAQLNEEQEHPIELRIVLNSGVALAGDMGSPKRREYTVLGDVVNTAFRLKTVAPPGSIVISRATLDRLQGTVDARLRGRLALRGRAADVEVFEVVG